MTGRPPSRRALAVLAVVGSACLVAAACSGSEGPSGSATTTVTTGDEALEVPVYSDPAQVITVDVGRRFAVMVPADPAQGWRWVVEPVDTKVLAPLGSEFRDDPALLAQATTTTTAPPATDPATPTTLGTPRSSTTTAAPTTSEAPSTTTTAPGPLVQIVSYAGRATGVATITLRYERIGTGGQDDARAESMQFRVIVGTLALPPPPETVPG
jgi:hypothetical protein